MNSSTELDIKVNGTAVPLKLEKNYATIRRSWKKGDVISIDFPMPVRRVVAHDKLLDDKGRVALERGPVVFCAEGIDNKDGNVTNLVLPDKASLRTESQRSPEWRAQVVLASAIPVRRTLEKSVVADPEQPFTAIPYYAWAHRGLGQMNVWPAREISAARPLPAPTIAYTSKVTASQNRRGPDLELRLIELGWEAPTHQPGAEDTDPDGSPNWSRQWPAPVAWAEASQVAAMTLREVYGVRHPARLRYHAFHSQGTPILLPTLGIRREEERGVTQPVWPTSIDQLREAMERGILPLPPGYFFTRFDGGELLTAGPGGFVAIAAREAPFRVLFYSRLLQDLDSSPELLEALNERNAALLVGRLYWQDGCVMVDHATPAEPFVALGTIGGEFDEVGALGPDGVAPEAGEDGVAAGVIGSEWGVVVEDEAGEGVEGGGMDP